MSWSGNCIIPKGSDLEAVQATLDAVEVGDGNNHCTEERDHQVKAAKDAAKILLVLGCGGKFEATESEYSVTMGGHANPDHKAKDGWSNDAISVAIYQRAEAKT